MSKNKNYELINKWENNHWNNVVLIIEKHGYNIKQYFLITMDIDTKTIKPKDTTSPFTYENKRYLEDDICGYTSQPLNYISEESKKAAEKLLNQNLCQLRKIVKNGQNHPAWNQIEKYVKQYVKHYESDFYFHDTLFMSDNPLSDFILSIGENGSHIFIYSDNFDSLEYVVKNYRDNVFLYWHNGKLEKITGKEAQVKVNNLPKFIKK